MVFFIDATLFSSVQSNTDRPWGPPSLLYNGYRVFPGVKRPGRGVDHPPTYYYFIIYLLPVIRETPGGRSRYMLR